MGALLIHRGKVIGMHQEGVNALVARLHQRAALDQRMELAEELRLIAARSGGQAGIRLLASYFPPAGQT